MGSPRIKEADRGHGTERTERSMRSQHRGVLGWLITIFVFGVIPLLVVAFFVYVATTPYTGLVYSTPNPDKAFDWGPVLAVFGVVALLFFAARER
jgi:ABC-type amino acid transport system permease subunit